MLLPFTTPLLDYNMIDLQSQIVIASLHDNPHLSHQIHVTTNSSSSSGSDSPPCPSNTPNNKARDNTNTTLCVSKECVKVAAAILSDLDTTVNPCDDFYLYSCGGWIKNNPIPDGQSDWSMFKKLAEANELVIKNALEAKTINQTLKLSTQSSAKQKARKYYYSCIDKKGSIAKLGGKPLLDLMEKKLGTWQLLENSPLAGSNEEDDLANEEVLTNRTIFQNRSGQHFSKLYKRLKYNLVITKFTAIYFNCSSAGLTFFTTNFKQAGFSHGLLARMTKIQVSTLFKLIRAA